MQNLSRDELIIINEALLDKVKSLQEEIKSYQEINDAQYVSLEIESESSSLLCSFFVDKHFELTDELVAFIKSKTEKAYYRNNDHFRRQVILKALTYYDAYAVNCSATDLIKELVAEENALEAERGEP